MGSRVIYAYIKNATPWALGCRIFYMILYSPSKIREIKFSITSTTRSESGAKIRALVTAFALPLSRFIPRPVHRAPYASTLGTRAMAGKG